MKTWTKQGLLALLAALLLFKPLYAVISMLANKMHMSAA